MNGKLNGDQITARQREVIALVRRGLSNSEIAGELGISEDGVKAHLSRLYLRFGVTNRVALLAAVDETAAPARMRASTLGELRQIAGMSRQRSQGLTVVPPTSIGEQIAAARESLSAVDAALDVVRELPAETTGPVLDVLRKRLASAVLALDNVGAAVATRSAQTR